MRSHTNTFIYSANSAWILSYVAISHTCRLSEVSICPFFSSNQHNVTQMLIIAPLGFQVFAESFCFPFSPYASPVTGSVEEVAESQAEREPVTWIWEICKYSELFWCSVKSKTRHTQEKPYQGSWWWINITCEVVSNSRSDYVEGIKEQGEQEFILWTRVRIKLKLLKNALVLKKSCSHKGHKWLTLF